MLACSRGQCAGADEGGRCGVQRWRGVAAPRARGRGGEGGARRPFAGRPQSRPAPPPPPPHRPPPHAVGRLSASRVFAPVACAVCYHSNALRCRCETVAAKTMPAEEEPAAMESRDSDGSPQQFCLRWNNYQSNLANCFDQLLQTESFVDVTLACEGQSLKAHKVVLSACSPYFQSLFMDNPCRHPIIIMRDIKYCDLKAVVDFMYRGEINVSQDQITALLKVAETLKIRGLTDVSGEHAVLRPGGVEARAPKRPVSREAESPAKARRRVSSERSPGPSPRRSPSTPAGGADLIVPPETPPTHAPAMPPLHSDDGDIRPGIAEMIREEERVSTRTLPSYNPARSRRARKSFPAVRPHPPRALPPPHPRFAKVSIPYGVTYFELFYTLLW